ncbi:DUF2780 domain-containing protein [Dehalogenimonas etheniformans]|uniref:DUF2780 domain-containing protein n=1 Tax=Dehalogenimonas etheniformans TaxID=1536648 RepID=A0A2P5P713_9CHLR|nr:DUF2780 domain-containing protein [Dehalogenimonas etheniformans]PPD58088.1 hypothetical protein JP09_007330 [Dehalogenimonas etheniformans]QNT75261.1 DUF2780 domain-containing protein [Dehalogenimonas etheniformans]
MELLDQLTTKLGVSESQAKGGVGLLFKQAKERLTASDFSKVSASVPGVDSLIKAAPSSTSNSGVFGKIFSAFSGNKGGVLELAGGFSKLGLNSSMISKFIPIILAFVQSKGGDGVKGLLEKALK